MMELLPREQTVKLRQATDADVEEVSELWLKMVQELAPDLSPNVDWWQQHAHIFMQSNAYTMFVVEDKGKIVGFIDYFLFSEPATSKNHAVFQHFYVIPEYRNGSASSKLYRIGLKSSKKCGAEVIELCCFPEEVDFWKKHGCVLKRNFMRREVI